MRFSLQSLIVPLVAAAVLALTLQQTIAALHASGSWQSPVRGPHVVREDPYSRVDDLLANNPPAPSPDRMRNPFTFAPAHPPPADGQAAHAANRAPHKPPPPARPTLTSIIWDNDPRATVRYDGRDISVRVNTLFADFRVKSITANEVVLDRNGESIVLTLRPKGE